METIEKKSATRRFFSEINPVTGLYRACRRGFSAPGRKDVWRDIRSIPHRAVQIRQGREITPEIDMSNWATIEKLWGFQENQRGKILKGLMIEILSFILLIIMSIAFFALSPSIWTGGAALILIISLIPCIAVKMWRHTVLQHREFVSFFDWLRGY